MDAMLHYKFDKDRLKSKLVGEKDGKVVINSIFTYAIRRSLLRGENFVGIITGRTRSGKSFTALRMCMEIDPDFSIDRVVFSAQEFMDLLHSGKLKAGDMILWDEAGVGIATRDWYSILNKSINYVLQTWGHKNIGLILTVPDMSFVDSQTRKLVNIHFKTIRLIRSENYARLKAYYLSPMGKDTKLVRPRYYIGGRKFDVTTVEVKKPPTKIVNRYLKKKEAFTKKLNEDVLVDITKFEEAKKRESSKTISDEELIQKAWISLRDNITIRKGKRKLDTYLIKKRFGVTLERARYIKNKILERSEVEDYPSIINDTVVKKLKEPKKEGFKKLDPKNFI